MSLTRLPTVVVAVLLLCAPAGATTLEATGGGLSVAETACCPTYDVGLLITGPDWELQGFSGTSWIGMLSVSDTLNFYAHRLTLHGTVFQSPNIFFLNDSTMTISHDPAAVSPAPPLFFTGFQPFSLPFAMTGHIPLAGGVDLAGHGILTVTRYEQQDGASNLFFSYRFTAPEPPDGLLLALGGLALCVGLRRSRQHRER
jgi:hypothetical protein